MHDTGADKLCAELIRRVEEDRREPDKILCHLAWARRILSDREWTRGQVDASTSTHTPTEDS